MPPLSLLRLKAREQRSGDEVTLVVNDSAVFSTWLALRSRLQALKGAPRVVLDLSGTTLVDHTVMDKLHEIEKEFREAGSELVITGLERHQPLSALSDRGAARRAAGGGRRRRHRPVMSACWLPPDDARHAPPAPDLDAVRQPGRGRHASRLPSSGR